MLQKFLREGAQTPEFANRARTEDAFWEDYYRNIYRVLGTVINCEPVVLLHAAELMTWFEYFGQGGPLFPNFDNQLAEQYVGWYELLNRGCDQSRAILSKSARVLRFFAA